MGKGTDKLYITHSEWASSDSFSASVGARADPNRERPGKLPFNYCAASLQPFRNPVCTPDGTVFDAEVIASWLQKHETHPATGRTLLAKDLIKLNFARNAESGHDRAGDLIDPVSYKVFNDSSHIVAVRHGSYANVFSWETVERMNIKAKMWRDLVDDLEFTRRDIIVLQDPHNLIGRGLSRFQHPHDGDGAPLNRDQEDEGRGVSVNIGRLGGTGDKTVMAKEAVERARRLRAAGGVVKSGAVKSLTKATTTPAAAVQATAQQAAVTFGSPANIAVHTNGLAAASFTSTGLTPVTSGERALLSEEQWMLKPKRVKNQGYARIETNVGDLIIELHADTAPKAVWNFVKLAQNGYYKGVVFHRNIRNFMVQTGDPSGTGKGGQSIWGKPFEDELDGPRTHAARGVVSMANKGKNTNSSQFFITYRPCKHLDRKHSVFGRVVDGMDVLGNLENLPTDSSDRPLDKTYMKDVIVLVDPFEEFLRELKEKAESMKSDLQSTDDDKVTWTGKRIRQDSEQNPGSDGSGPGRVGKYLSLAARRTTGSLEGHMGESGMDGDSWAPPDAKRRKEGDFGNFDNW